MDKIIELPYCTMLVPLLEQLKLIICFREREILVKDLRQFAFKESLGREV